MDDFPSPIRILDRKIQARCNYILRHHTPAFGRIYLGLLHLQELCEIGIIKGIRLPHIAARLELIIPGLTRPGALLEEEYHGLDAGP